MKTTVAVVVAVPGEGSIFRVFALYEVETMPLTVDILVVVSRIETRM